MLTLFAIPKPFKGHINIIQRNAIKSWTLLRPQCEIILLGDDEGTADAAKEFGVEHIADIARNEFGTPLLNDMFEKVQKLSNHELCCFVNSDIILMNDFTEAAQRVVGWKNYFLMGGRRWDVDVNELLDYGPTWREELRAHVASQGQLHSPAGIDYFVFRRGFWGNIPPFAIGRIGYDNWLVYRARSRGAVLIDATPVLMAVHQNHNYSHHPDGIQGQRNGAEAKRNFELAGGTSHIFTLRDATHVLTANGPKLALDWRHLWCRLAALPALYPRLGLPIRALLIARDLSRPVRGRIGLTLSERDSRHG